MSSHRDDMQVALPRHRDDRLRLLLIGRNDRPAGGLDQIGEQPQLRSEIGVERRMIIEMIAAEIGERAGRHPQPIETILVQPMGRRLDDQMRHALAGKAAHGSMQCDGVRRRESAIGLALWRDEPHCADAGRCEAELRPNLAGEGGNGGFPAGAGDGGNDARHARKELRSRKRERPADIVYVDKRNFLRQRALRRPLGHYGRRTGCEGLIDKAQAVVPCAGHRDEQLARPYTAAVRADAGKVERRETCVARAVNAAQSAEQIA